MENIEIPKAARDLDKILDKCKWRHSNHYENGEWEQFSQSITGADGSPLINPTWTSYISELEDSKLITNAFNNRFEKYGYIATAKAFLFKGYVQTMIDKYNIEQKQISEIEALKLQINDLKGKRYWFWSGAIVSFIAALIGGMPTIIQQFQNKPQVQQIEVLKTVKVDTVIVKK